MIRAAVPGDTDRLAELALLLWPGYEAGELRQELAALLKREDARFFSKETAGELAGFAQCQLRRDYVEGTCSSPVGYLEGILSRSPSAAGDTPGSFWRSARTGPGNRAAGNSPATARWKTAGASGSTGPRALPRRTASSALSKSCEKGSEGDLRFERMIRWNMSLRSGT